MLEQHFELSVSTRCEIAALAVLVLAAMAVTGFVVVAPAGASEGLPEIPTSSPLNTDLPPADELPAKDGDPFGQWIALGPDDGATTVLATDPGAPEVLYAGTPGGVYRSRDRGETWTWAGRGAGCNVAGLIAPEPSVLFAVVCGGQLFRSGDRGQTWVEVAAAPESAVVAITADPRDASHLIAPRLGANPLRSTDGGDTWDTLPVPRTTRLTGVAFDPTGTLYGLANRQILRSDDGGTTWQRVLRGSGFTRLATASDGTAYVRQGRDLLRSRDRGETWTRHRMPNRKILAFYPDPHRPERLFVRARNGGIWLSEDQGSSFSRTLDLEELGATSIHFDPNTAGRLYAASPVGALLSQDNGTTWVAQRAGLGTRPFDFLVPHPRQTETVYGGNRFELMRSNDRGRTWQRLRVAGKRVEPVDLAIDPNAPNHLFLATSRGLFESFNGGAKWFRADRGEDNRRLDWAFDVSMDPLTPGGAWVLTADGFFHVAESAWPWRRIDLPGNPRPQFAGQIVVDPSSQSTLWLLLDRKELLRSTDSGQTWTLLSPPLEPGEEIGAMAIDPQRDGYLHLGTSNFFAANRVISSGDAGDTWMALANGLPAEARILGLAVDAGTGALYAGTLSALTPERGGDVYRLPFGNDRWRRIGDLATAVHTLSVERRGRATVWVGTRNRGALRLERQQ